MGIIPAYAGNTRSCMRSVPKSRDHPRVCGEHTLTGSPRSTCKGSSPRMRGTHQTQVPRARHNGIIPAYAGNTELKMSLIVCNWDHPRVCGEHMVFDFDDERVLGSSPRMRGTHDRRRGRPAVAGIIPAYAGNTGDEPDLSNELTDHPRVCGEHPVTPSHALFRPGSSPRMRGTRCARSCRA